MIHRLIGAFALVLIAAAWARPGSAATTWSTPWQTLDFNSVRLVAAPAADGAGPRLGLHIRLAPGFKTYWRVPGDGGIPPSFDWTGSRNLRDADVRWPAPTRYDSGGSQTIGYADEVIFPVHLKLIDPGRPVSVRLAATYGVCKDICVLNEVSFALDLPAASAGPGEAELLDDYERRVPVTDTGAVVLAARVSAVGTGARVTVDLAAPDGIPFLGPDVFVEGLMEGPTKGLAGFDWPRPRVASADGGARATATFAVSVPPDRLVGRDIEVTLVDGPRAAARRLTLAPAR